MQRRFGRSLCTVLFPIVGGSVAAIHNAILPTAFHTDPAPAAEAPDARRWSVGKTMGISLLVGLAVDVAVIAAVCAHPGPCIDLR